MMFVLESGLRPEWVNPVNDVEVALEFENEVLITRTAMQQCHITMWCGHAMEVICGIATNGVLNSVINSNEEFQRNRERELRSQD